MSVQGQVVLGFSLVLMIGPLACRPREASTPPTVAAPSTNPCRGRDLDLERLPASCEHEQPPRDAPPKEVLQVALEAPKEGIPSGGSGSVWLRFRNASANRLDLQLNAMCGERFHLELLTLDGSRRVDLVEDVGGLGLCGTVPGVRVELEPGGVLSQRLKVSARVQRYAAAKEDGPLDLVDAGPIAPGHYLFQVWLPLSSDRLRDSETQIEVKTPITIVPAQQ